MQTKNESTDSDNISDLELDYGTPLPQLQQNPSLNNPAQEVSSKALEKPEPLILKIKFDSIEPSQYIPNATKPSESTKYLIAKQEQEETKEDKPGFKKLLQEQEESKGQPSRGGPSLK